MLKYLAITPNWTRPAFAWLEGKHKGIGEIRFKVANVQYRPLGCKGVSTRQFVLLMGCSKKGAVYTPTGALDASLKRRRQYLSEPTSIMDRDPYAA